LHLRDWVSELLRTTLAREQVDAEADVACARDTASDVFDVIHQTAVLLDDNHGGDWRRIIGPGLRYVGEDRTGIAGVLDILHDQIGRILWNSDVIGTG
jgi:hypothetical protein